MPITVGISSITKLSTLQNSVPLFDAIVKRHPTLRACWDGIVGALVLNLFMGFVPTLLMFIFKHFFALKSESWCQQKVHEFYFLFLALFVLLITTIGNSLLATWMDVLEHPGSIFELLASTLPQASHFYLNYLTVEWAVQSMGMTRYVNLIKFFIFRTFNEEGRARELSEPEDQEYSGIGARSARLTLLLVITLVFCTLSPLICLIAFVTFVLYRVLYGYLTVFAEVKKPDLGGVFWCTQLEHVQQGLFIYITLMVGILLQHARNRGPSLLAAGAYIFLAISHSRFSRAFHWEYLPFEEITDSGSPKAGPSGAYEQPELRSL